MHPFVSRFRIAIFILACMSLVKHTCLSQSEIAPAGTWKIGSVSPAKFSHAAAPPGGLLFQLKGGLPIVVHDTDITVSAPKTGVIAGKFLQQGVGSFTHSFKPDKPMPSGDTIFVTISGNLRDVLGDFLDGNENNTPEGSPEDDYKYWFTVEEVVDIEPVPAPVSIPVTIYPVPSTQNVHVQFLPDASASYTVDVYSLDGRVVRSLHRGVFQHASSALLWDRRDYNGNVAPAGLYFISIETGGSRQVLKAVLM